MSRSVEPSVAEASELTRNHPLGLRLNRWLRRCGERFELETQLKIPAQMEPQALAEFVGMAVEEVPSRAEILLQRPDGGRSLVAVASGVEATEGAAVLVVEAYPSKRGWRFRGVEGLGVFRLWIGEGTASHGPLEFAGCRLGRELPWAFARAGDAVREDTGDDNSGDHWRFVAEGSFDSRQTSLAVFVPSGWQLDVDGGQAKALGEINAIAGAVYEVTGHARLRGPEAREVLIRTSQAVETATEMRISGATFGTGELFRGAPQVIAFDSNGEDSNGEDSNGQRQSVVDVEWRPAAGDPATGQTGQLPWRPMSSECLGQVQLRVVEDGAWRFLEQLAVAPVDLEVDLERGAGRQGKFALSGLTGAEVSIGEVPGLSTNVRSEVRRDFGQEESKFVVVVEVAVEAERPAGVRLPLTLNLELTWDLRRRLTLQVPFPSRGVCFIGADGRTLKTEEQIPVDRLTGVRALATTFDDGENFALTGRLLAEDVTYDVELYEPIPRLGQGYFEMDLGLFQEPLRRMLSASQDLDAEVRLWVEADGGGALPPRRIQVARFDSPLALDEETGEAAITESNLGSELIVEALPLWKPESQPMVLEATEGGDTFRFDPKAREAGPWLLLGWDGDGCRFRPTLWMVGDEGKAVHEDTLSPLQQAIRIADRKSRRQALATEMARLAETPGDPGWAQVEGSIERQHLLPAATFELLRELIQHPAAAVGALTHAPNKERFAHAWSVLEQLPFAWRLVPLRAWMQAVEGLHHTHVAQHAQAAGTGESADEQLRSFLDLMGSHRPFLKTLAAWLQLRLLGEEDPSELGAPTFVLEGILEAERQSLFARTTEDWWPRAPQSSEWLAVEMQWPDVLKRQLRVSKAVSAFKRPVLTAPLLAAFASALDLPTQPFFLFDMRRLRAFDARFFDATYENGLRLALAVAGDEIPVGT